LRGRDTGVAARDFLLPPTPQFKKLGRGVGWGARVASCVRCAVQFGLLIELAVVCFMLPPSTVVFEKPNRSSFTLTFTDPFALSPPSPRVRVCVCLCLCAVAAGTPTSRRPRGPLWTTAWATCGSTPSPRAPSTPSTRGSRAPWGVPGPRRGLMPDTLGLHCQGVRCPPA
jgi:hypothetical protein